ncbi:MAG: hypothetical protein HQL95_08950 [Magnetococcales bacterium]|nr:hypothetical protein [Magnetococcales bacterium]
MKAELSRDGKTIIVSIPMQMRRRGGRTMIIAPDGLEVSPPSSPRDGALLKHVVKAHHWLRQLERGRFGSVRELAETENLDISYVSKILNLTLLAPDIVESILDGRQPDVLTWQELKHPFPMLWSEQRKRWGIPALS